MLPDPVIEYALFAPTIAQRGCSKFFLLLLQVLAARKGSMDRLRLKTEHPSDLLSLSDELLLHIFSLTGNCLKEHNQLIKKLYNLWRASTTSLSITEITTWARLQEVENICATRFPHISELSVQVLYDDGDDLHVPAWCIAWALRSKLHQLSRLTVKDQRHPDDIGNACHSTNACIPNMIRLLAGQASSNEQRGSTVTTTTSRRRHSTQQRQQLATLALHQPGSYYSYASSADIMLLSKLRGIHSLDLLCSHIAAVPATAAQGLADMQLQALKLKTDEPITRQQLRVLTGALPSLTALALYSGTKEMKPDSLLAIELSCLTRLQELSTDLEWSPEVQQQLTCLQHLTALGIEEKCVSAEITASAC